MIRIDNQVDSVIALGYMGDLHILETAFQDGMNEHACQSNGQMYSGIIF